MNEREIFEAALDLIDPQARQVFLDQACTGNPELRQQVEELLVLHATGGDFLSTPAVQPLSAKTTASDSNRAAAAGSSEYEKTQGYTQDAPAGEDAVALDFLSPSEKPGSLGKLGHYEVHELLGHGAFGIVLKAFDEKLHRMVAIKVLSPELAKSSPPRKRFLREARSAAAIRHEHVVAIYAVEEQPIPYLVMEYIPGITMEQALTDHGPLDVADVLRLGQQIAAGLAAAHAQGLIHRDIKPSNILLENGLSGRVKITDFGLARTADDASMTQSGTIAGTPLYMSPEQATSGDIDQRSDLFSLGSVLYVMISGRPPFRAANTLAVLKRVVDDTPRPIPTIIADTPSWLCAIIAKLQAKQPNERFATASEVADLLGRCLADLQANRPVQLPAGMQVTEVKVTAIVDPEPPLIASETAPSHPQTLARSHPRTLSRRPWPTIAAAALILLAGLGLTEATGVTKLTSTVIRLTTGSGTLIIETDDPGVKVTIDGEEVRIQGAGVEQLTLKPGQYKIAAVKDGKPVSQELVMITRGGKEVVRVTMEGIASSGTPVSRDPKGSVPATDDPDRRAAEWVLSIGGLVMVSQSNQIRQIDAVNDLPRTPFQLTWVDTDRRGQIAGKLVTDSALTRFGGCRHLKHLDLRFARLTDAGLENFKECKKLEYLSLGNTEITDTGLIHFRNCPALQELRLYGTGVTDSGVKIFKDCKKLVLLYLGDTLIGDDGLANFQECKLISALELNNTQATDRGLLYFKDCQGLRHLNLAFTQISDAGLDNLRSCHEIQTIHLNNTNITDHGLRCLKDCNKLQDLYLSDLLVTDAGLSHLENFDSLKTLQLKDTQVTEAGVKQLAVALPKCRIEWDGGVIEPRESSDGWHGWPADAPTPAIAPFDAATAKKHQEAWAKYLQIEVEYTNSLGMKFVLIPPGEFTMGSTPEEIAAALKDVGEDKHWQECIKSEAPQHKVILTQPIYLGMNEVTQADYEKVMGVNPSHFAPMGMGKEAVAGMETTEHPVEMVSWNDAAEFCAKLSKQEKLKPFYYRAGETITPLDGTGYRLPSEAEWEFACRAGTTTKYWIGDQDDDLVRVGWFGTNSGGRTHAVGELKANPFGLSDMHGNVWEWVQDGWDVTYYGQFSEKPAIDPHSPFSAGSRRVLRGGYCRTPASHCRSSDRLAYDPAARYHHTVGFRVSLVAVGSRVRR